MKKKAQVGNMQARSALKAGRQAAIACVKVLADLQSTALAAAGGEAPDYRPRISRLYAAIRNGWEPICRCWPKLVEIDVQQGARVFDVDRPVIPPIEAWLMAKTLFWTVVVDSPYEIPARVAWQEWSPEFIPHIEGDPFFPEGDENVWTRVISFLPGHLASSGLWQSLIENIQEASVDVAESGIQSIPDQPSIPGQPKPLPDGRSKLLHLLQTLDQFIGAFEQQLARLTARNQQQAEIAKEGRDVRAAELQTVRLSADDRQLPPPIQEVEGYVDPIALTSALARHDAVRQRLTEALKAATGGKSAATDREVLLGQKRLIEASHQLLDPFRDLRGQILDKLDESEPGEGGRGRKRRKAKGQRGRPPVPGKAERDKWIRDKDAKLTAQGKHKEPKKLLEYLLEEDDCEWPLTYNIVGKALRGKARP